MPLGMEVIGLGPGDFVFVGDPAPQKKGHSPHPIFGLMCGQTARWIKIPLGTEVITSAQAKLC